MGIQIYDEKQNVIYVPDNEKENKADGSVLEKRHLEKAKKHCLKYGKYPELVESNNIIKPYYEIYKCNKYK